LLKIGIPNAVFFCYRRSWIGLTGFFGSKKNRQTEVVKHSASEHDHTDEIAQSVVEDHPELAHEK